MKDDWEFEFEKKRGANIIENGGRKKRDKNAARTRQRAEKRAADRRKVYLFPTGPKP